MLPVVTWNVAVLTIAAIYYVWRDNLRVVRRQHDPLNERVAHLLWAAAQRA
jgi:hypothetical protein